MPNLKFNSGNTRPVASERSEDCFGANSNFQMTKCSKQIYIIGLGVLLGLAKQLANKNYS